MSDSDDTDLLIFMPPDFFVIHSPRCLTPTNHITTHKETVDSDYLNYPEKFINNFEPRVSVMENGFRNSTPFHPKKYSTNLSYDENILSPVISSLDLSTIKTTNTWPPTDEHFMQNTLYQYKDKLPGFQVSLPSTKSTVESDFVISKTNKSMSCGENGNLQSPKFSLGQVDKQLSEMEKTREVIKHKLQSNKNKIYEMRKEYSNDINDKKNSKKDMFHENTDVEAAYKKRLNTENMLHLSKIMSKDIDFDTLQQKLEAERLKKKHCEKIIGQLQTKLLEQEQNMNVAVKVDFQKDEAISQLHQSWSQLIEHCKKSDSQKQDLALMLKQERVASANAKTNFVLKVEQLEARLHEAICLANDYREKNEGLENKLSDVIHEFEDKCHKNEGDVKLLNREKIEITQKMEQAEKSINEERTKRLLVESKTSELQTLLSEMRRERDNLVEKCYQEESQMTRLKEDFDNLESNFVRASASEAALVKEVNILKQENIRIKSTLKEFYQKQLDAAITEKLGEFQKEVDKVQALMHVELHKCEKIAKAEIDKLKNEQKIEISEERRINQKHVNILKSELKESRKKMYQMENRLKLYADAKQKLSQLIHTALRTQRLDILTSISEFDGSSLKDSGVPDFGGVAYNNMKNKRIDRLLDLELVHNQDSSIDLKRCIQALLQGQPRQLEENYIDSANAVFSKGQAECTEKKTFESQKFNDGIRKKPPWK